jgi:hypothetical protein
MTKAKTREPPAGTLTTAIPMEYLVSLGRLHVQFALLEHRLAQLIKALLGGDSVRSTIATANMRFQTLVDVCSSLYRHRLLNAPDRIARMEAVLGNACAAEAQRNQLVHSMWIAGDAGAVYRTKINAGQKKGLVVHDEQMTVEDIEAVVSRLAEVTFDVMKLGQELPRPE